MRVFFLGTRAPWPETGSGFAAPATQAPMTALTRFSPNSRRFIILMLLRQSGISTPHPEVLSHDKLNRVWLPKSPLLERRGRKTSYQTNGISLYRTLFI